MVPLALSLLGLPVELHDAYYAPKTPDDIWLSDVGAKGWTVISHDPRFQRNEASRQAIIQYGVGCFVLGAAQGRKWEKVRLLARAWDEIDRITHVEARPYIYRVYRSGTLKKVYPTTTSAS